MDLIWKRGKSFVKKLTVGSLKYDGMKSSFSIDQAVNREQKNVNETNRTIEIKQNQRYFQVKVKKGQSILERCPRGKFVLRL